MFRVGYHSEAPVQFLFTTRKIYASVVHFLPFSLWPAFPSLFLYLLGFLLGFS